MFVNDFIGAAVRNYMLLIPTVVGLTNKWQRLRFRDSNKGTTASLCEI